MKKTRERKTGESSSGMTLIEVLVTLALTSIMMFTAYTFLYFIQTRAQTIITIQTRDSMQASLLQNIADIKTLQKTRTLDATFNSCFLGGMLRAPCPGEANTGVSLYHISGSLLAGPPDHPAYFTFLGSPCQWPSPNCVLAVTSYVRAQGVPLFTDGSLVTVRSDDFGNETIEIHFQISVVNRPGMNLRDLTGSIVYDIADVLDAEQITD